VTGNAPQPPSEIITPLNPPLKIKRGVKKYFETTGGENSMKILKFIVVMAVACLLAQSVSAEMKSKKFTNEEIKKMSETTAVIETKFGNIELKFFPDVAPNHVNSFIGLAKKGFYDGTTFHRVIPGFMIQGGDPNSKNADKATHGTGGPGYTVKAEFSDKPHKRGTLSMARAADPNSAGSQFFICVADAPFLNKQYTVFGEVVSGMDVVDKIVSQPRDPRDNPTERVEMKVKVVEKK
jgi:peptidyl-prolyl cis-trans isomerase B (cyclophilin B)